jgi:phosphoribosylformylglycinamidine synthase
MVRAIGEELCPVLGVAIPVGKDSLSMRTVWQEGGAEQSVTAPVSLVVSAFAPVTDIRRTMTPGLARDCGESALLLIDLAGGRTRLGGSCLAQSYGQYGGEAPDVDDPERLRAFFKAQRSLRRENLLLAYHDRSDGGLLCALLEMAFASHLGLDIAVADEIDDLLGYLFAEEIGAVVQVAAPDLARTREILAAHGFADCRIVARPTAGGDITIRHGGAETLRASRIELHRLWSELSFRMQELRDDPDCAREAHDQLLDEADPGLNAALTFDIRGRRRASAASDRRPKVAVLREQGVNGQREMAAALDRAQFDACDVHMTDILAARVGLDQFRGIVACGGFSFGDVLGAGEGWAKSILYNDHAREQFTAFLARQDAFALGVCNGCQMLTALKTLVPGAESWPRFVRNRSDQFEARLSLVAIEQSPSILFAGMAGSRLPIVTSHGEGRAEFTSPVSHARCDAALAAVRYVTHRGVPAEQYPANPNGSPGGLAGLCNADGRVTVIMPHPERVFRTVQLSWHPPNWPEESPWQRLFDNARDWVGSV